MDIRNALRSTIEESFEGKSTEILAYLPEKPLAAEQIKAIMINEVAADEPANDFYSKAAAPAYLETTKVLFQKAGREVHSIDDILDLGIYITNAVKLPKTETTISRATIQSFVPILAEELALFPNLQAVMLNGDVAKKAFNMIAKNKTGKNAVPAVSTYKLRHSEIFYGELRVFPAYIMTGKNILIEKSKVEMTAEDIAKMLRLIEA